MQSVDLTFLQVLEHSYNQLEGLIPQGKQFNTFGIDSYEGKIGIMWISTAKIMQQ